MICNLTPVRLALLAAISLATPAGAEPAAAPVVAAPDPFQQAIAAQAVADFARRQKDPQAMIVAARMLQEVPFADSAKSDAAGAPAAFTPAGLFGEAKALAKGDQGLLMQINVAQAGSRGVFASTFGKGLVRLIQNVAAQAVYRFDVDATGGQVLRIGAIGDIGTAMVMRLANAAGRIVCEDNSGYAPVCATTPGASGRYHVEIANRGRTPSKTVILSN